MNTINQTIKALNTLAKDVQYKVAAKATRDTAKILMQKAKDYAPVRTGALKESIKVKKAPKKYTKAGVSRYYVLPSRKVLSARVAKRVKLTKHNVYAKKNKKYLDPYYAHFVELGTKKMRARAYLKPAAEAVYPNILEKYEENLQKAIAKAAK